MTTAALNAYFVERGLEIPEPSYQPWEMALNMADFDVRAKEQDKTDALQEAAANAKALYTLLSASKKQNAADLAPLYINKPSEIMSALESAVENYCAVHPSFSNSIKNTVLEHCRTFREKLDDATLTPLLHTLISEARAAAVQTFFTDTKLEIQNPTQRPWEVAKMIAYQSGDDSPEADLLIRAAGRVKALYELLDFSRAGYDPAQEEAYLDSKLRAAPNVSVREALEDATVATKGEYRYQRYTRGHHKPNEAANPKTNNIPEIIGYLKGKKPSEIVMEFEEALNIYKEKVRKEKALNSDKEEVLVFYDKEHRSSFDATNSLPADVAALKNTLGNDAAVAPLLEQIIAEDRARRPEFKINAYTADRMMMSQSKFSKALCKNCAEALEVIRAEKYPEASPITFEVCEESRLAGVNMTYSFTEEGEKTANGDFLSALCLAINEVKKTSKKRFMEKIFPTSSADMIEYGALSTNVDELAAGIKILARKIDRERGIDAQANDSLLNKISKIQSEAVGTSISM